MPKTTFNVETNAGPSDAVREYVLSRDAWRCQYCGVKDDLIIEHVIPFYQGGHTASYNLVAACVTCNCRKRGLTWLPNNIADLELDNSAWAATIRERAAADAPAQHRRDNSKIYSYKMDTIIGERFRQYVRFQTDRPIGEVAEEAIRLFLDKVGG